MISYGDEYHHSTASAQHIVSANTVSNTVSSVCLSMEIAFMLSERAVDEFIALITSFLAR